MTTIEWTDETLNVQVGCSLASKGCQNCYAMKFAHRQMSPQHRGITFMNSKGPHWNGKINYVPEMLRKPLHWHTPRKIFLNSLSDLFHESVPDEWIDDVHGMMWACLYVGRSENSLREGHVFQLLTKRAARARAYYSSDRREKWARAAGQLCEDGDGVADQTYYAATKGPHPRIWLGTSCEDQEAADERIPLLLQCPAAVHWVSAEPLLGPIDFTRVSAGPLCPQWPGHRVDVLRGGTWELGGGFTQHSDMPATIDWIVCGGESGPRARPCAMEWIESIMRQCRKAGTACFVKQLGAFVVSEHRAAETDEEGRALGARDRWLWRAGLTDRKGADPEQWPDHLSVREFPEVRS